jgi:uncharacterized RDD family membrane protein YckC
MTNPYAPPQAAVRDLADPRDTTEPADRGSRLAAYILDGLIAGALIYLPFMVGTAVSVGMSGEVGSGGIDAGGIGGMSAALFVPGMVLGCIGLIIWAWLNIKFVLANGQSIGKKIVNIKVVRSDGSRATLSRIFWLRNVVNTLISLIPLYGLVDILFVFSESRQCLHDRLADTIVIKA